MNSAAVQPAAEAIWLLLASVVAQRLEAIEDFRAFETSLARELQRSPDRLGCFTTLFTSTVYVHALQELRPEL